MKYLLLLSLVPALTFAEFRTYVSVDKSSDDISLEVKLPHEGEVKETKLGQKFEIPYESVKAARFKMIVQMSKKGATIMPCEIDVEMLTEYDRSYVCTAHNPEQTFVRVRVYTNLHGGDKMHPDKMLATRK